jgi:hypothetical protein
VSAQSDSHQVDAAYQRLCGLARDMEAAKVKVTEPGLTAAELLERYEAYLDAYQAWETLGKALYAGQDWLDWERAAV